MAKLSSIVFLGGVALFAAWRMQVASQEFADVREHIVADYKLNAQQTEVYDGCLVSLKDKKLKNGGVTENFCGCLAKSVMNDYGKAQPTIEAIRRLADVAVGAAPLSTRSDAGPRDVSYLVALTRTEQAMRSCADDQRSTFASKAEIQAWCAAKSERATDRNCTAKNE